MSPPQQLRQRTSNCSSLVIYRPRKDERLSWPSWLTYSGWFTHISGHPSATGRAQDSESTLAKDRCSTAGPRNQPWSVCWSVCRTSEPCKNSWTDRDAVWVEDLGGPKGPCIRWGFRSPMGRGKFLGESVTPCAAAMRSYVKLLWPLVCYICLSKGNVPAVFILYRRILCQ